MPARVFACMTFVVLVLAAGVLPAQAQRVVRGDRDRVAAADSSLAARYSLADALLRAGQYDRAIALFEDLYAASPETYAFYEKLKQAYESLKRYDDAIALVDARLQNELVPTPLRAERARLLYQKGDEAAAKAAWQETIDGAPGDPNRYRYVYNAMVEVRLFEEAAAVLEQARAEAGEPALYQTELAYLYSLNGQHDRAVEEYLGLLEMSEEKLSFVRNRMARFLEQQGALDSSIDAAEKAVRRLPLNRAYRELLGWLYMEADQYRRALDSFRAIDRLEQEQGRTLFAFAERAADAGAYDVALDAFEEVLQRYPDSPAAAEARFGRAEMHERWAAQTFESTRGERGNRRRAPHYEAALEGYRTFLQQHPTHAFYPEALRRIGRLQQDVFFDLGAAEATLREVIDRYPRSEAANAARYDLGRIALMRGNLGEANIQFSRLVEDLRLGELAELARYEMALLHFYRGEFDAAQTLATVLDENTSTDVANDAIALKLVLIENRGPDSLNTPLRRYAEAALLQRQHRPDEVVQAMDALIGEFGQHPIADDARFLRAEALLEAGRTEDALAAFLELPLLHARSHLNDRSLFEAGKIQSDLMGDDTAALDTFTRLLTTYPGSLLVPEVRARIRRIRGDERS